MTNEEKIAISQPYHDYFMAIVPMAQTLESLGDSELAEALYAVGYKIMYRAVRRIRDAEASNEGI